MTKEIRVNEKHKDRLFNFIFGQEENREWTLSPYNAINGSNYTDASLIEFNTLEGVLYMNMKNDTSFIISGIWNVYEHQSSFNPNMPYRMLEYIVELFSGYVKVNKLNKYGSSLMKFPIPKLVVFYNGIEEKEDEVILRLSDSFDESETEADIEVKVRMLNVNFGRNKAIMQVCKPLEEYAWVINRIRETQKKYKEVVEAVDEVVESIPNDFVIRDLLIRNRAEVYGMLDTEYNEAEIRELFMEDGRREERANTERERIRADEATKEVERLKRILEQHNIQA
jgi:hypothetical protein